jgi:hypothetical protein
VVVLKFLEETDFANGSRWHSLVFRLEPNLLHGDNGSCASVLAFVYYSIRPWLPFDQHLKPHVECAKRRERYPYLHRPFQFSYNVHMSLPALTSPLKLTVQGRDGAVAVQPSRQSTSPPIVTTGAATRRQHSRQVLCEE